MHGKMYLISQTFYWISPLSTTIPSARLQCSVWFSFKKSCGYSETAILWTGNTFLCNLKEKHELICDKSDPSKHLHCTQTYMYTHPIQYTHTHLQPNSRHTPIFILYTHPFSPTHTATAHTHTHAFTKIHNTHLHQNPQATHILTKVHNAYTNGLYPL